MARQAAVVGWHLSTPNWKLPADAPAAKGAPGALATAPPGGGARCRAVVVGAAAEVTTQVARPVPVWLVRLLVTRTSNACGPAASAVARTILCIS